MADRWYPRQAIETLFLGPTNHRGRRVKARSQAGSVTVSWDHALNPDDNHTRAAETLARKWGWAGTWYGGARADGRGNVYVWAARAEFSCAAFYVAESEGE